MMHSSSLARSALSGALVGARAALPRCGAVAGTAHGPSSRPALVPRRAYTILGEAAEHHTPRPDEAQVSGVSPFHKRMSETAEIMVSKLIPAGAGWQAGAIIAESYGLEGASFCATVGLGDALGVSLGHITFGLIEGVVARARGVEGPNMETEVGAGVWLGSAAFCSGSVWQPTVDALTGYGFEFAGASLLTGAVCGTVFFGGLRAGRVVYSRFFHGHLAPPDATNWRQDASLAVAIGGASGMFVATDAALAGNPFVSFIGITESMSSLTAIATAGMSTGVGYGTFATLQATHYD